MKMAIRVGEQMKKLISMFVFVVLLSFYGGAYAEKPFLELASDYINRVVDCSEKESFELSVVEYDTLASLSRISFDFREGNQSIMALDGDRCILFFYFDDSELLSALFQMITMFDEIDTQLSSEKHLQYEMIFSDTEIHYITAETMQKHYIWLNY